MRTVQLSMLAGGIDRQRPKGGASADWLYDLVNGYVTEAGTAESRPGTYEDIELPAGCKGLVAFDGKLVTFRATSASTGNALYEVEVITDPVVPASPLFRIHFAAPFLGYLYVVAEFESGNVYHYWLQEVATWAQKTPTAVGDVVQPTVPNGYVYRAHRLGDPNPVWAAGVPRTVGDVVEPTESNGFKYEVIDTLGTNPRSGSDEPDWPEANGETIIEDADLGPPPGAPSTGGTDPGLENPTGSDVPGSGVRDRYDGIYDRER